MKPFWVVWNEQGQTPMIRHNSALSAKNESERLARVSPGKTFHVLRLVASCSRVDVNWEPVETMIEEEVEPF